MKKILITLFLLLPFTLKAATDTKLSGLAEAMLANIGPTSSVYVITNEPVGSAKISLTNILEILKSFDNFNKLNGNQFASNGFLISLKSGAFATNIYFYQSNAQAQALVIFPSSGSGTNWFEILNPAGQPVIYALTNNGGTFVASNSTVKGTLDVTGIQTNRTTLYVDGGIYPLTADSLSLGDNLLPWRQIEVKSGGVLFDETGGGADVITLKAPPSSSTYTLNLPVAQGADGDVMTNNGTGQLNWWSVGPIIGAKADLVWANAISNLAQTKQTGSVVLSNLVGTIGRNVTNLVSLSTSNATSKPVTNSYANGIVTVYGLEQGSNTTLFVNGSNIVLNGQWGLSNVVYVQRGQNISNLFFNAVSGTVFIFDSGTNRLRGILPTAGIGDYANVDNKLTNLNNIVCIGNNTIFYVTNNGMGMAYQQVSNLFWSGITWRGTRTNDVGPYQESAINRHGLLMPWGTNYNVTWQNCVFEECNEFGLLTGFDAGGVHQAGTYNAKFFNTYWFRCGHTNWQTSADNIDGGAVAVWPDAFYDNCTFDTCSRGLEAFSGFSPIPLLIVQNCLFKDIWMRGIVLTQPTFASKAIIENNKFIPNNAARRGGNHLYILQADGAIIKNNFFTNIAVFGDYCIFLDAGGGFFGNSRNIQVVGNYFSHINYGIAFQNQFGGSIIDNMFFYTTNATIQLAGDGVTVRGNYFYNCGLIGGAFSAPLLCLNYPSTNNIIIDNYFVRKSGSAPNAWITLDSLQRDYKIVGNFVDDFNSGVSTLIDDGGIGTRLYNAFGTVGYPVTLNTTTNYLMTLTDTIIGVTNATALNGARVITLTNANQVRGRVITIFDVGRTAAGTNITINTISSETFNGSAGMVTTNITEDGGSISLFSANGGWWIFEESKEVPLPAAPPTSLTNIVIYSSDTNRTNVALNQTIGQAVPVLSYRNSNGAPVLEIDNRGFLVITNSLTNRVATPTNTIAVGADSFGGFNIPTWTEHTGLNFGVQPFLPRESFYWIASGNGSSITLDGLNVATLNAATISHPAPTEQLPYMADYAVVGSASNTVAGTFSAADIANAGAHDGSSKAGGYFFNATWMITNNISGIVGGGASKTFVGLTSTVSPNLTNIVNDTNATGQYLGLYSDTKQSLEMFITARDSGNEFRTNTGINFVASNIYKIYFCNTHTSRFINWRLDDVSAGLTASGRFSNNVPTNFMKIGIITKSGTNRAHSIRFSRLHLIAPLSPR